MLIRNQQCLKDISIADFLFSIHNQKLRPRLCLKLTGAPADNDAIGVDAYDNKMHFLSRSNYDAFDDNDDDDNGNVDYNNDDDDNLNCSNWCETGAGAHERAKAASPMAPRAPRMDR